VWASKTFFAAAVLILAARTTLSLDDDVSAHLPELAPAGAPAVALRHLLSMTNGLRDGLGIERPRGRWQASPSTSRGLPALACRQRPASAPSGVQYMYANVNALPIRAIIARVSGMADQFVRARSASHSGSSRPPHAPSIGSKGNVNGEGRCRGGR
jgi:CubicO group peptidase (beta-lactamase class C family)